VGENVGVGRIGAKSAKTSSESPPPTSDEAESNDRRTIGTVWKKVPFSPGTGIVLRDEQAAMMKSKTQSSVFTPSDPIRFESGKCRIAGYGPLRPVSVT